jgi:hypothetical protein
MGRVSLLRLASNDVMAITKCRILATPVNQFSPAGEIVSYTAQASELWITDGRSLTSAVEILEDAFQWWRKFIDEMSIS